MEPNTKALIDEINHAMRNIDAGMTAIMAYVASIPGAKDVDIDAVKARLNVPSALKAGTRQPPPTVVIAEILDRLKRMADKQPDA